MTHFIRSHIRTIVAVAAAVQIVTASAAESPPQWSLPLYVDRANNDIRNALPRLQGADRDHAQRIASFPIAAWLTGGTPKQVQARVAALVSDSTGKNQLPVLVAYNLPYRDCQQYSAGGAAHSADYQAWIDGLAAGIGAHRAIVILEPDGLGIVPHYTNLAGTREWCQPAQLDAATATDRRFAELNYAVDRLVALPNTAVYLDGTHSNWLDVGDNAHRLVRAGVQRTRGFFLNVSNYRTTPELVRYGAWVAKCIHHGLRSGGQRDDFAACASHLPGVVDDENAARQVDAWYDRHVNADVTQLHRFVIDTSRNGRGPWTPPAGKYADAQAWCNPPGRGLGERPIAQPTHALLDAKLWIKVPGESDGECYRGTGGPLDPERGMAAPPAGKWFKEQAAELVEFANPPLQ
jgi:endoglucanase